MPSSSCCSEKESYYTVLELNQDATRQEIRDSYKRLAILRHPDKNMGDFANACTAFQKLQEAFSILSDPLSRIQYDKTLVRPVSDLDTQAPESPRRDSSDDEKTTSAPGSSPRRPGRSGVKSSGATYPRSPGSKSAAHHDFDDGHDATYKQYRDKYGKEGWRTEAGLEEALRESMQSVGELLKKMKSLVDDDDYPNDVWVDIKGKVNGEMRFQDGLRRDLERLQAAKKA